MKKKLLILFCALLLTACADKNQYEQAILAQMQKEKDVTDYKIAPEDMVSCVVAQTANKMPGIFALDPTRLTAYRNYAKMLSLSTPTDPNSTADQKAIMDQLRTDFGSPEALAEAHTNYTESVVECYSVVISKSEAAEKEKK
jgi:PBP1b-binding outer membrane lipoprotein LpoB